jgi:hypothetical protein
MVEANFLPITVYMTFHTVLALLSLMSIITIFLVAAVAGRRGITVLKPRLMAVLALDLWVDMRPFQRVVGRVVIKGLFVERRDIHVSSLMLVVTGLTSVVFKAPVISPSCSNILRHVPMVVTIQAQIGLSLFFKIHVTIKALLFKLRMSLNKLARHDHFL